MTDNNDKFNFLFNALDSLDAPPHIKKMMEIIERLSTGGELTAEEKERFAIGSCLQEMTLTLPLVNLRALHDTVHFILDLNVKDISLKPRPH
jgi:hypothetical protein